MKFSPLDTWVAPSSLVRARAWDQITQLAQEACALSASLERGA